MKSVRRLSYKQHKLPVKWTATTTKFYWNLSKWGLPLWVELEGGGRDTKNCFRAAFCYILSLKI